MNRMLSGFFFVSPASECATASGRASRERRQRFMAQSPGSEVVGCVRHHPNAAVATCHLFLPFGDLVTVIFGRGKAGGGRAWPEPICLVTLVARTPHRERSPKAADRNRERKNPA